MVTRAQQKGFTLVEMLVSLALFTTVATISVGTLLVLMGGNGQVVDEQSVMTSLNYAMDSMTREIRTGTHYYCGDVIDVAGSRSANAGRPLSARSDASGGAVAVQDCSAKPALSFRESGTSVSGTATHRRIAYYYDAANDTIMRQIGNDPAESILSNDVRVTDMQFVVTGTTPLERISGGFGDVQQPTVAIIIRAEEDTADGVRPLVLHTTITQRALDL